MCIVNQSVRRQIVVGLIIGWTGTLIGCGGSHLSSVEGTVTFDNQPVEQGSIIFEPADGVGPSAGGDIVNGGYRLAGEQGVAPGQKIVRIIGMRKTGEQVETDPGGPLVDDVEMFIPAEYNQSSTLRVEVPPGQVTHDFELTAR